MAQPPRFSVSRDGLAALRSRVGNRLADLVMDTPLAYRAAMAVDVLRGVPLVDTRPYRGPRRSAGRANDFKGATTSHLQQHWRASTEGANAVVSRASATLRARSRDLVRNNAHAASAVGRLTTRLIGCGIRPRSKTGDPELDRQVNAEWELWAEQASATDDLTIYGLQHLAVRSMLESGEVLLRRRSRRSGDISAGRVLRVPLQLQLLEADHLDARRVQETESGGWIQNGVEFDAIGRRRGYWLHPVHPGETSGPFGGLAVAGWSSVFVDAGQVGHLYDALRPGQVRGVPMLAPVMVTLRDLDEAQDAELVRMRMAASLVAMVSLDESAPTVLGAPEDGEDGQQTVTDVNGNPLERLEPGMVAVLRGSKDVRLSTPSAIGGFPEYVASQLQRVAAGLGMPYEVLASDLSRVNYSSYRAGNLEFRAMVESMQERLIVPLLCQPTWRWFVDAAIAAGVLPDREYPVEWAPPRYEDIDRVKEATADVLDMRAGTASRTGIIARKGYDPEQVLAEIVADNEAADAVGAVFDSDPRKTNRSGAGQSPGTDAADGDASRRLVSLAASRAAAEGDEEGAAALRLAAEALGWAA